MHGAYCVAQKQEHKQEQEPKQEPLIPAANTSPCIVNAYNCNNFTMSTTMTMTVY
ncbi:unnamed protein product, partial [Ceratitis capitata]